MAIRFFEEGVQAGLRRRKALKKFIQGQILAYDKAIKKISINYVFCNDEYLLEKNIQFLNHHTLTDIITFDLSPSEDIFEAEIYISVERVAENAEKFGVSYENELHRVMFHGVLHLLGYGDKTDKEKERMRALETEFIQSYGLIN